MHRLLRYCQTQSETCGCNCFTAMPILASQAQEVRGDPVNVL